MFGMAGALPKEFTENLTLSAHKWECPRAFAPLMVILCLAKSTFTGRFIHMRLSHLIIQVKQEYKAFSVRTNKESVQESDENL